jgi:beta-exotoxin I transport system permease protein
MNRGLIRKTILETWAGTMFFGAGLFAFQILLAIILPNFQEGLGAILEHLEFVRYVIAAMLGTEVSDQIGPQAFSAFPWVHPAVLSLLWAHGIMFCTRVPAAEIEHGTMDVLLSLPVRRSSILVSDTFVWIGWGCVLAGFAFAGNVIGGFISENQAQVAVLPRIAVAANMVCVYLCVGAVARVLSSLCDRRSWAIGAAFAIVVASFAMQTLAMFSEAFASLSFLGLLKYYRPLQILSDGRWAVGDMIILLLVAGVLWGVSLVVFSRRDIRTN